MTYEIGYAIPGAAFRVGRYRMLRPGLARYEPWWTDPGRAIALPERRYPLDLRSNFTVAMEERIALPAGWRAVSMPRSRRSSHRNGSWSIAAGLGPGQVIYRRQATLADPYVRTADYRAFRQSMLDYLDARQGWIVLQTDLNVN
ncbi:MAG TPA: hypothetical protein VMF29_06385, partial [Candidatus Edwardsbacteria bacterium]|nr:hypothetical protein [Candidatus Edwardsbacteria bacterium]